MKKLRHHRRDCYLTFEDKPNDCLPFLSIPACRQHQCRRYLARHGERVMLILRQPDKRYLVALVGPISFSRFLHPGTSRQA